MTFFSLYLGFASWIIFLISLAAHSAAFLGSSFFSVTLWMASGITFDPRMLRQMVDVYGAEHVVLGTDYPYDMADMDPVGSIGKVPRLTRAERDLIEGGNAARLLKLGRRK